MPIHYGLENAQSLLGIVVILLICWGLSENKRRFPVFLAMGAIGLQVVLILALFAIPQSHVMLGGIANGMTSLSAATDQGMQFVFGYMGGGAQPYQVVNEGALFVFALRVLPLILVISALSALLWHIGVLKIIIRGFGYAFEKLIGLGGATSLGVASGIFVGNVESLIIIKGYLDKLTRSELFVLVVVGMANVAGSTMVAYVLILQHVLPNAAGHILAAAIVSAPAGVLLARIIVPDLMNHKIEKLDYDSALKYDSAIDAVSKGTVDGMMVAVNIAAILIVMVALAALTNMILSVIPPIGGQPVTIERALGVAFTPLAWLIGVPWNEAAKGGEILGIKMVLTEFVAFLKLAAIPVAEMTPRTRILLTYATCGFANIGSVGITVAGFGALMPDRRPEIMTLIWKALAAAFLATCLSAAIVGALPNAVYGL
ncbi:NupC/NupG family nucleoside CNT transporter [Asticcacaulis benevestitus]|uniref:Sodium dependent nucleoside transporter n=1 Tax=Asticcacaulis benevestitus DSM 16100 = ATCC BAA-896 TaxID=1121022 RepID=V4PVE0_9CAUL|nr:nucleoside transporter C-terminal domain-containing protein [Asticcacaulis benevestitus]ESQ92336.1 sodium dependent nucleoside transporter [Asticcacaulis benevestitus DSM 16100 = ATCC BAA-896]